MKPCSSIHRMHHHMVVGKASLHAAGTKDAKQGTGSSRQQVPVLVEHPGACMALWHTHSKS